MSLVERAIKKLQESSRATAGAAAPASVTVPTITPPGPAVSGAQAPAPVRPAKVSDKIVETNRTVLRSTGLLPPEHQERQIADQYRQIKRPLVANATGRGAQKLKNGHLIMMASALPGEGKTFTSINLALSLAMEKDISVLLVDADIPKPHISRIFGVETEPGLIDALANESIDIESLILPTDTPRLSILPAGMQSATATELLASARMEEALASLGAHEPNRIVLLDSPPLLLTSESRVLASAVGQIVLVIQAGRTSQKAVLDAITHLGDNKVIGLILNQSDVAPGEGYYGYSAAAHSPKVNASV